MPSSRLVINAIATAQNIALHNTNRTPIQLKKFTKKKRKYVSHQAKT